MSRTFEDLSEEQIEQYNKLMKSVSKDIKENQKDIENQKPVNPFGYAKPPRLRNREDRKTFVRLSIVPG